MSAGKNGSIVALPSNTYMSNHRYLDVMTTRTSQNSGILSQQRRSSSPLSPFSSQPTFPAADFTTMPSTYLHAETHNLQSRPISAAIRSASSSNNRPFSSSGNHHTLLIEPILLPNLQHVHVDAVQDLEESCLFYPDGRKNKNIRREIESSVVKHHILENNKSTSSKKKDRYRIVRKDVYANVKPPPLYYTKKDDPEMKDLLKNIREKENKITGTVMIFK
jgi:hypothetical protein